MLCSHDTQSTHWDSPRGIRQQAQLKEIQTFIHEHKEKLKVGVVVGGVGGYINGMITELCLCRPKRKS